MKAFLISLLLTCLIGPGIRGENYDPLAIDAKFEAQSRDLTAHDARRNRDIPVRIYLPANEKPQPVVLFSHGLGGSRAGSKFLAEQWTARGYVAVFIQHPGSDDAVWKDAAPPERMDALREAASLENFLLRVKDVPAVLDQLEVWNKTGPLAGRMDLTKIGMSGHSFGAVTTEAVGGETFPTTGQKLTDARIRAAVIFSPSAPKSTTPERAFGDVKIPWLLMTGTNDVAAIGDADMKSRLAVYPALHGAPKYQVVLDKAEHSAFTDRALPGEHEARNPNHHRVIRALSTAFWDAYLRGDKDALAWLNGAGPRSVMEAADDWKASP
ncbi:MAG TPA: dienelactone hydrolase [Chthoniobacterales bacterium]|jgi:predicted dienelactone hydrolase|nr:dienelactone hydrolase [Chthoniobacterales bacterium]